MAESSGFFRSVGGDRKYTVDFLAQWVASFLSSGVYADDLAVTAGENMQIVLPAGRAWINGYYYRNDSALALPLENADGVLNRRDTVVLRWDVNERTITAQVLTGTPASNPEAPAITRTAEQYDLKLAEISIPAGTTATTQALITDTRMNDSVCGIVTGVVAQVDTTTFYNQIAADLAEFKSSNEAGFTAWANGLKDVLNESAAGNLLNLINQRAYTTLSCTKSGTVYALTGLTATSGTVPVTFKATAAYAAGDTVTIDGTAYALATRDGSALTSGAWAAGAIITGVADVDAKALTVEPSSPVGAVQGNTKSWVATVVAADDPIGNSYQTFGLTIPGFVFSEGCSVTFLAPQSVANSVWSNVSINGARYDLRTLAHEMMSGDEWVANTSVTVILSAAVIPLGENAGREGTAFFKGGVSVKEPYDFPLSIQTATPTPVNANHIWIHNDTKLSRIFIAEAIQSNEDNAYFLIEDTMDNAYWYFTTSKTITSGEHDNLMIYKPARDNVPWHAATWIGFAQKHGITMNVDHSTKWPRVYSKINGVVDMEDAQRWDGSAWQWLSQKGLYLLSGSNSVVLNRSDVTLFGERSLGISGKSAIDISKDRNYVAIGSVDSSLHIFKRIGDGFTEISSFSNVVYASSNVAFSPDSQYIATTYSDGTLYIFKKNSDGTWSKLTTLAAQYAGVVAWNGSGSQLIMGKGTGSNGKCTIMYYDRNGDSFSLKQEVAFRTVSGYAAVPDTLQVRGNYITWVGRITSNTYTMSIPYGGSSYAEAITHPQAYMLSDGRTITLYWVSASVGTMTPALEMKNSSNLDTLFSTNIPISQNVTPYMTVTADERYVILSSGTTVYVYAIQTSGFSLVFTMTTNNPLANLAAW